MMTLEQAIDHAKVAAFNERKSGMVECAAEHEQLVMWLEELAEFRKQKKSDGLLLNPMRGGARGGGTNREKM